MNRRAFLGAIGSVASVGTLAYATQAPIETLEVRVWLSEQAGSYESVRDRIRDYLSRCFDFEFWSVNVSIGGTVAVTTEDGARVTSRGEWPFAVASGAIGASDIEPTGDVNLLVTDGQMVTTPTGYGLPHLASVGGARHIASLEPFEELVGPESTSDPRWIVPPTTQARTIQVLIHEVGHALGLDHSHGVAFRKGDTVVATPMISTYAFDADHPVDRSQCGTAYPEPDGRERALSLAFSACARRELATRADGEYTYR